MEDVPKELERKVIPLVMVRDSAAYLDFLSEVFGAECTSRVTEGPDSKVKLDMSFTRHVSRLLMRYQRRGMPHAKCRRR